MIKNGMVVTLSYHLTNNEGETLDRADTKDPFVYLHGQNQIVPGLESALLGLKAGDKKKVTIPPAEAYGEINPQLRLKLERKQFPAEMPIEPGIQFQAHLSENEQVIFTIMGTEGEDVLVDGNHPLAGETLNFDVEVISMREATKEELEHGHAHGPGGHHHH